MGNFATCGHGVRLRHEGEEFCLPHSEAIVMAFKEYVLVGTPLAEVLSSQAVKRDGGAAKAAANRATRRAGDPTWWRDHAVHVLVGATAGFLKFSQDLGLRRLLLSTQHAVLIETAPADGSWGVGMHSGAFHETSEPAHFTLLSEEASILRYTTRNGTVVDRPRCQANALGKSLMLAREMLREAADEDTSEAPELMDVMQRICSQLDKMKVPFDWRTAFKHLAGNADKPSEPGEYCIKECWHNGAQQAFSEQVSPDQRDEMLQKQAEGYVSTDAVRSAAPGATAREEEQSELIQYLLEQDPILTGAELQLFRPCGSKTARIDQVAPRLYLGSRHEAKELEALQSLGVRAIVNAAAGDVENHYKEIFTYHDIVVADKKDAQGRRADILPLLDPAADFISDSLKRGACFVHCMGGYSRSPTVVIAYLIKHGGLDLSDALRLVKRGRPQVEPNEGFMEQLLVFESKCRGTAAKTQVAQPKALGRKKK